MKNVVIAYTDGACKGNPGPGGWGVVLEYKGKRRELCGGESETTNNRMELTAAIRALETLTRPCHIQIVTDSVYVAKGMSEWMPGWLRNNWKTSAKEPVKNADLWQRLLELQHKHKVEWHWIKGHAGHPGNERADQLANDGIAQLRRNRP